MRCKATVKSENYNMSLLQSEISATQEQINSVARGLCLAVGAAFKNPVIREEYDRWLEEQKGKESNVSNNS